MSAADSAETPRDLREDFGWFCALGTRWKDNDVYGHVNNVAFYSYFDTAANQFLIEKGGFEIASATVIGVVVESKCQYREPVTHPQALEIGVRANRIGRTSVEYGLGVFQAGAKQASAVGYFTHVFVARDTMRPVPIPDRIRAALETIQVS